MEDAKRRTPSFCSPLLPPDYGTLERLLMLSLPQTEPLFDPSTLFVSHADLVDRCRSACLAVYGCTMLSNYNTPTRAAVECSRRKRADKCTAKVFAMPNGAGMLMIDEEATRWEHNHPPLTAGDEDAVGGGPATEEEETDDEVEIVSGGRKQRGFLPCTCLLFPLLTKFTVAASAPSTPTFDVDSGSDVEVVSSSRSRSISSEPQDVRPLTLSEIAQQAEDDEDAEDAVQGDEAFAVNASTGRFDTASSIAVAVPVVEAFPSSRATTQILKRRHPYLTSDRAASCPPSSTSHPSARPRLSPPSLSPTSQLNVGHYEPPLPFTLPGLNRHLVRYEQSAAPTTNQAPPPPLLQLAPRPSPPSSSPSDVEAFLLSIQPSLIVFAPILERAGCTTLETLVDLFFLESNSTSASFEIAARQTDGSMEPMIELAMELFKVKLEGLRKEVLAGGSS